MRRRKKRLRSPIKLQGGKGVLRNSILKYFPSHKTYVEPFGGGASLLLGKEPSEIEIYNDIDPRPVSVFRVVQDPSLFRHLQHQMWFTPYSREEREFSRTNWQTHDDLLWQAHMFLVNSRQSFGGLLDRTSWGFVTTTTAVGKAQPVNSYIEMIRMLASLHGRLQGVVLHNEDWAQILSKYDSKHTLFYLDPPYLIETRRDGWFNFEMTEEDHARLVKRVLRLKGKVILSGYINDTYATLTKDHGWKLVEFNRTCNSAARTRFTGLTGDGIVVKKQPRIDCIWMSPNCA